MAFPVDVVPDGAAFAPHHFTWGVLVAFLALLVVWDDYREREPAITASLLGLALFSFLFAWPYYPVMGATLTLVATVLAFLVILYDGVLAPYTCLPNPPGWLDPKWEEYALKWRVIALVGVLVAVDDAVEHALGWPTPLDAAWSSIAPHVSLLF
jgi:apolipoprotein N-acyltransferase